MRFFDKFGAHGYMNFMPHAYAQVMIVCERKFGYIFIAFDSQHARDRIIAHRGPPLSSYTWGGEVQHLDPNFCKD